MARKWALANVLIVRVRSLFITLRRRIDIMADPTREQLRQLHGAFGEFWDTMPWRALDDLDVVAVEHPSGRYTGYCSVLGSAFREYGLAVFIGDEGLAGYLDLVNEEVEAESPEGFDRMNALLAVRGDRESLSESERAAMRRARLRYRGRGTWPIFRSLRPGYLPWRLDEDEAVFLAAALGNMTDVASRVSSGDLVLHGEDDPDLMLMRVFRDGVWSDRWKKYPAPVTSAPVPEYHDPERLRRVNLSVPRGSAVWEVGVFYVHTSVQEERGNRPYFPTMALAVDRSTSLIVGMKLLGASPSHEERRDALMEMLENADVLPSLVVVDSAETARLAWPILYETGVELTLESTPGIYDARSTFEALKE